ncbi:MAG: GNAT family N-acetyltransferase [Anaerolineae bacterium]|jgi:RimJ/RimL family protein N-acetyltransferase|nr:GNAT family N-acetyltransferase [Anaerolineae bacterium]
MSSKKMNEHELRMLDMPQNPKTDRLVLQVVQAGDGAEITAAKVESFDRLKPWFPWAQDVGSAEENESWVRQQHAAFWNRTAVEYKILLAHNSFFIGMIGIHLIKKEPLAWEIGYWLRSGQEGKGYMTEAVKACTELAFNHLKADKILIRADSRNIPSQKVAERCGYHRDGLLRWVESDAVNPQNPVDMYYYSLIRPEYEANKDFYQVLR